MCIDEAREGWGAEGTPVGEDLGLVNGYNIFCLCVWLGQRE